MNNNRYLYCDEIIPEGRMVCPLCNKNQIKVGSIMQSIEATKDEVDKAYGFMEENNDD